MPTNVVRYGCAVERAAPRPRARLPAPVGKRPNLFLPRPFDQATPKGRRGVVGRSVAAVDRRRRAIRPADSVREARAARLPFRIVHHQGPIACRRSRERRFLRCLAPSRLVRGKIDVLNLASGDHPPQSHNVVATACAGAVARRADGDHRRPGGRSGSGPATQAAHSSAVRLPSPIAARLPRGHRPRLLSSEDDQASRGHPPDSREHRQIEDVLGPQAHQRNRPTAAHAGPRKRLPMTDDDFRSRR
jgi:hypothetical protein